MSANTENNKQKYLDCQQSIEKAIQLLRSEQDTVKKRYRNGLRLLVQKQYIVEAGIINEDYSQVEDVEKISQSSLVKNPNYSNLPRTL